MRVLVGSNSIKKYNRKLKHDNVVMVLELFGPEDDWSVYDKLNEVVTNLQDQKSCKIKFSMDLSGFLGIRKCYA